MRSKNLHELVLAASARWGKRPVFRHVYGGKVRELAYEDLPRLTFLFAQALVVRGVKAGDRIILCADNCPEWVIACLGALRLGVTVVPVDSRSRQADMEFVAEKVKPALFVLGRMQFGVMRDTIDEERTVLLDEFLAPLETDQERPHFPFKAVDPDSTALIVFTSGTSGVAKGVMLSHANISSNVMEVAERFPVECGDKLLSILPLSHMFEFTAGLIGPMVKGACIVFSRLRGPEQLRELLRVERTNALIGVPAIYSNILKAIETKIAAMPKDAQAQTAMARKLVSSPVVGTPLSTIVMQDVHRQFGGPIKFWAAGGAPVPEEVVRGLASFGIPVLAGYGLTEASPIVACNTLSANRPGSVGRPLKSVQVRIRAMTGDGNSDALVGSPGEILARGPNVMQGYFGDEAATAEVIKDGWLYTGDVGHLDADGYLYVTGRIKSTIVTAGGYNIHPEELEKALEQSPMIKESCVFGVSTPGGEQAHAIIVAAPSALDKDKEFFRAEIGRCVADLAEYKRLSGFELYQGELPRTRTNKIQRSKAAELYEALKADAATAPAPEPPKFDEDGEAVRDVLLQLVAQSGDEADAKPIAPQTSLCADLGIDSFSRLELALRLEDKLSIDLPEEAVNDVQTVDELITLVKARKKKSGDDSSASSENFDALMRTYASFVEIDSPQARRLMNSVVPWPHGKPYSPQIHIKDSKPVQTARLSLVAAMRLALKAYNHYEASGREKLNIEPPYIVIANHTSHIDTAAIFGAFPLRLVPLLHPVAASDLFFRTKIGAEVSSTILNAVSFDRYGDFETSMAACREVLQKGEILIMFPEGTRSTTGKTGPFRHGVSQLATAMGCPVIPAYIDGGASVLPKKGRLLRPGKLRIAFGDALQPPVKESTLQEIQAFTKQLEAAVEALKPV
jgi:long-chain acyl-CoA synthetase